MSRRVTDIRLKVVRKLEEISFDIGFLRFSEDVGTEWGVEEELKTCHDIILGLRKKILASMEEEE